MFGTPFLSMAVDMGLGVGVAEFGGGHSFVIFEILEEGFVILKAAERGDFLERNTGIQQLILDVLHSVEINGFLQISAVLFSEQTAQIVHIVAEMLCRIGYLQGSAAVGTDPFGHLVGKSAFRSSFGIGVDFRKDQTGYIVGAFGEAAVLGIMKKLAEQEKQTVRVFVAELLGHCPIGMSGPVNPVKRRILTFTETEMAKSRLQVKNIVFAQNVLHPIFVDADFSIKDKDQLVTVNDAVGMDPFSV